jgi:hypothetical protein
VEIAAQGKFASYPVCKDGFFVPPTLFKGVKGCQVGVFWTGCYSVEI